ncbi:hypothetical protein JCM21900_003472 [Sporobolomyces salmonicolor]
MFFRGCWRCVTRSFRAVEKQADRATRFVGPLFVAIAVVCIAACAFAFFEYYKAITTPPGSPLEAPRPPSRPLTSSILPSGLCFGPSRFHTSSFRTPARERAIRDIQAAQEKQRTREESAVHSDGRGARAERYARECKKCESNSSGQQPPKPERTHHCSVCRTCVLKFDHHCPWIKGCVGLHNERYFLLFLCYFSVACFFCAGWGFAPTWRALSFYTYTWEHRTPRSLMLAMEVLAIVMGLAVFVMAAGQLWLIAKNETSVESNDNDWYRKVAKSRGRTYLNPYDLGWQENFRAFFNVGPGGYHWSTVFLPVSVPPSSDGWTWPKRENWRETGMAFEDELTDEEEMSSDEEAR